MISTKYRLTIPATTKKLKALALHWIRRGSISIKLFLKESSPGGYLSNFPLLWKKGKVSHFIEPLYICLWKDARLTSRLVNKFINSIDNISKNDEHTLLHRKAMMFWWWAFIIFRLNCSIIHFTILAMQNKISQSYRSASMPNPRPTKV